MKFAIKKKYFTPILVVLLMFMFSISVYSQSGKKRSAHEQEWFEANAAAVAYINCKFEVTNYYSKNKPDDIDLKKELAAVSLMKLIFTNQVAAKYSSPDKLSEEFSKEVNSSKKKLSTCVKYQNILLANEKLKGLKEN